MKPPSFAPVYASFFPVLAEISQKNGYALAIHGSLLSDMDLVAIPWTDEAVSAETLMKAIAEYATSVMGMMFESTPHWEGPETKPHGRVAWSLGVGNGAVIDLSVMPRVAKLLLHP